MARTTTRREVTAGCALALAFGAEAFAASTADAAETPAGFRKIERTYPVRFGKDDAPKPVTKAVLVSENDGPAVVVMHELFGFTAEVLTFCRTLVRAGFRVYAPVLFGPPKVSHSNTAFTGACIRGEINLLAHGRSSPIVDWLKPLAAEAAADCAAWGKGAGVIGLCLTGDFALAMAVEPRVLAPVMAEPSLPFRWIGDKRDLQISHEEMDAILSRHRGEGLVVKGYRFQGDTISYVEKFDELARRMGSAFARGVDGNDIPDAEGKPANGRRNHSVFTLHYNERSPVMRGVLADLEAFLHARLDRVTG